MSDLKAPTLENLYGAVLAGGRSSRMGCDKRFLKFNGELMIDRSLALVTKAIGGVSKNVYLCGDVPDRVCLPDAVSGLGPLSGILSAVKYLQEQSPGAESWLLVIPVDMPLLKVEQLQKLILSISSLFHNSCAAVAFQEFEMPFIMRCDSHTHTAIVKVLQSSTPSQRSIQTMHDRIGARRIRLDDYVSLDSMLNVNSPKELNELKTRC